MSTPSVLPDGTWIDNFRVVRRLGRGGFGVTYLAEEFREWEAGTATASPLRLVAIKEYFPRGLATRPDGHTVTLSPDVDGGEHAFQMALRGFFQESESLMRFDHPNVIKIHRVFQRNGTAYYVMPFLKGETLKAILKREGALGEERTRRIMLPILDGLIHAHAKGILHRDLKPDNVMVPDEGGPVLIDFGAARAQAVDDVQEYTRHSELVAYTPGYAALEQYGRATRDNPHGTQTDVYGLAAVMYHCVTGQAPVEASLRSMQLSNGAADPMVPASARMADMPGYSRAFLCAIDWGLELAGRNRPQTVADFRRALDGKLELPDLTMARLEQHGVSTEPFTQPALHLRPRDTQQLRDTQRLGSTRLLSEATDTVVANPATLPSMPSVAPLTRPTTRGGPFVSPPTLQAPVQSPPEGNLPPPPPPPPPAAAPPAKSGGGKALPVIGLLVSLAAVAFVVRDQLPDPLRALLGEAPAPVPVEPPPEVASVPEPTPAPASEEAAPEAPATPAPAEDPKILAEREAFDAAKASDTLAGWKAFKKAFPKSPLVATADIRIAALQPKPTTPEPKPPAAATATPPAPAPAPVPAPAPSSVPPSAVAAPPAVASAPAESAPTITTTPAPVAQSAAMPKLKPGGVRDCPSCPEMVKIEGGTFEMGDMAGTGEDNERPTREVSIAPFYAGRYEVTFTEWEACVAGGGCASTPADAGWGRGARPVIHVSWNDAQRYVAWLSRQTGKRYRLPTEAEFEYLNRAGERGVYPWGADGNAACTYANVADRQAKRQNPDWNTFSCDDGEPGTASVGSYRANAFGLHDVAGNVWEWTQDCYQGYRDAATDGSAYDPPDCPRRMIRGGSWSDAMDKLRSSDRTVSSPKAALPIVGFRVVRDP